MTELIWKKYLMNCTYIAWMWVVCWHLYMRPVAALVVCHVRLSASVSRLSVSNVHTLQTIHLQFEQ